MTAIAYRDGILAGDSHVAANGVTYGFTTKGLKTKDNFLVAAAGSAVDGYKFLKAVKDGEIDTLEDLPYENLDAILVYPDRKKIIHYEQKGVLVYEAPFHVLGAGSEMMVGAMEMGAGAEEAVRIACKHVHGCGGPIWVLK